MKKLFIFLILAAVIITGGRAAEGKPGQGNP